MNHTLKVLSKNNREMRTSLLHSAILPGTRGDRQFIIGMPEGVQRMVGNSKSKIKSLNAGFLPSLDQDSLGGLVGM